MRMCLFLTIIFFDHCMHLKKYIFDVTYGFLPLGVNVGHGALKRYKVNALKQLGTSWSLQQSY